jgi:hypothetical protein
MQFALELLLHADDLILVADSMEQLQLEFDEWEDGIEKKD